MATVDGVTTAPDANGVIQGAPGQTQVDGNQKLAGGTGNDKLEGHGDFNQYYGGAGNDTFILSAKFGQTTDTATKDFGSLAAYITDFHGAGEGSVIGHENDFLAFSGFGANSTLELLGAGKSGSGGDAKLYYYSILDSNTGQHYNFEINSLNGKALSTQDYHFVG